MFCVRKKTANSPTRLFTRKPFEFVLFLFYKEPQYLAHPALRRAPGLNHWNRPRANTRQMANQQQQIRLES